MVEKVHKYKDLKNLKCETHCSAGIHKFKVDRKTKYLIFFCSFCYRIPLPQKDVVKIYNSKSYYCQLKTMQPTAAQSFLSQSFSKHGTCPLNNQKQKSIVVKSFIYSFHFPPPIN